jgi:RNA polymerase-binding transcription factor DksA
MEVTIMSANQNNRGINNRIEQYGGRVWHRLHSEREEICEALLKESLPGVGTGAKTQGMSKEDVVRTANWHRELLQERLRKIDDALDRLMSGSYGVCCRCGGWIEDTKLDFDPAISFCIDCWQREKSQTRTNLLTSSKSQTHLRDTPSCDLLAELSEMNPSLAGVKLEMLAPFDTICVRTQNSDYRIFLLDPKTGRALVEGGRHFVEPVEAVVSGSTSGGSTLENGWIGIGLRIEMWVNGTLVSTSPVQSVRVEHNTAEPAITAIPNLEM